MTFVCLWIPRWSTAAASTDDRPDDTSDDRPDDRPDDTPPSPGSGATDDGQSEESPPPPDHLTEALLRVAPRVALSARGIVWVDGRGLPERSLVDALRVVVREQGGRDVRVGVARTAIAAEVAARGDPGPGHRPGHSSRVSRPAAVTIVPPGEDRSFLAPYPLTVLREVADPDPALLPLLLDMGISTCGELAGLGREEIEVRCGVDGVRLWQLARADDRRRPFGALPRTLPRASCAWTDYALRDGERLLFVMHRLIGHVCDALRSRGEGARALTMRFTLANRTSLDHTLESAHPTADRATWMRLTRTALEPVRFPEAVTGIVVRVAAAAPTLERQGDIFDRGFATAGATEQAIAQLLEACGADTVTLTLSDHPLPERRARWHVREPAVSAARVPVASAPVAAVQPSLTLQLLPEPQRVRVTTIPRRDHEIPVRYHEPISGGRGRGRPARRAIRDDAIDVLVAAGPDRIEGGAWEDAPYAREYFHCVTADGRLVLLFRTAGDGERSGGARIDRGSEWYLQGWWD